jgi:hypothetical protein
MTERHESQCRFGRYGCCGRVLHLQPARHAIRFESRRQPHGWESVTTHALQHGIAAQGSFATVQNRCRQDVSERTSKQVLVPAPGNDRQSQEKTEHSEVEERMPDLEWHAGVRRIEGIEDGLPKRDPQREVRDWPDWMARILAAHDIAPSVFQAKAVDERRGQPRR